MAKIKSTKIKPGRNRVSLTRAIRKPTKPKKERRRLGESAGWREWQMARLKRPPHNVVQ